MFVFVHVNKAAGETFKSVLFGVLGYNRWDGAGFGTREGWPFLGQTFWPVLALGRNLKKNVLARSVGELEYGTDSRGDILYSACGKKFSNREQVVKYVVKNGYSLAQARECPLRFVWGNAAFGLCDHFPGRPCVYITILRDPVARAISEYNYFCLDGAEGKKKWIPEWERKGECPIGILQWYHERRTNPEFYIDRFTRGCDSKCGLEAARMNLFNPCVRYLLTNRFSDGLEKLQSKFGKVFKGAIDDYLDAPLTAKRLNVRGHGKQQSRLKTVSFSNATLDRLREMLHDDLKLYREAESRYDAQWSQPVVSCNSRLTSYRGFY